MTSEAGRHAVAGLGYARRVLRSLPTADDPRPLHGVPTVPHKTILTPTGGFLGSGFTHSLNPYVGCAYAGALCGTFCYAQHNAWITRGRPWGLYGQKADAVAAYRRDHDRQKRPRRGAPKPLRIYMASSTDPYVPQEAALGLTRALLEAMLERPPDALVLQTHALGCAATSTSSRRSRRAARCG